MNGIALHGGYIPYGGTFLTFSDYSRNAVRMSALMRQRVIYVFTHDSIGLGEDGPTHQPVEHVSSLRLIPHNAVWRPCDAVETMAAWLAAIERSDGPIVPDPVAPEPAPLRAQRARSSPISAAAATCWPPAQADRLTLLATGSEVALALAARARLAAEGIGARVVSMPNCAEFDRAAGGVSRRGAAARAAGARHRSRRQPLLARLHRLRRRRRGH